MRLNKVLLVIILLVIAGEGAVLYHSLEATDLPTVQYQLAARYSARISFVTVLVILSAIAVFGLRKLYAHESWRRLLVYLFVIFAVNHALHFAFIVMNYKINERQLLVSQNIFGAVGYLLLLTAPFYLWNKKALTRRLQLTIHVFLSLIITIFLVTYLGRLSPASMVPLRSPVLFYQYCLALAGALLVASVFRFAQERRSITL